MLILACKTSPLLYSAASFTSLRLSLVIVTEGAVWLNNFPHLHILLLAYLLCYAGDKRLY